MTEIPSNPVARQNLKTRKMEFENTTIHRDYVVVRCEQNPAAAGAIREGLGEAERQAMDEREDVYLAAEKHHQKRMQEMQHRREVLKKLNENAKVRHEAAVRAVHMNKKREKMVGELEQLDLDDRRRKQSNAAIYAGHFRRGYVEIGQEQLKKKFMEFFDIENLREDGEAVKNRSPSPKRSGSRSFPTSIPSQAYRFSLARSPSVASSGSVGIDVGGEGVELVATRPRRGSFMVPAGEGGEKEEGEEDEPKD